MYKTIENDPLFDDIKSEEAKNNLNMMVDYLCSMPVPETKEKEIPIETDYKDEHKYISNYLYTKDNYELTENILNTRTNFTNKTDSPYDIDGYSYIYKLNKEKILDLGTMKYYRSIVIMEHELIHLLMALNNNNPKPQHNEILSFFGEFVSLATLSKRDNNPDVYESTFINRCVARMSYRVYASDFSDENIKAHKEWVFDSKKNSYPYMVGYIYAMRLLNIYQEKPQEVFTIVNDVLSGKITMDDLLNKYHISLTDSDTIYNFINICDLYREIVERKYKESELHSVR